MQENSEPDSFDWQVTAITRKQLSSANINPLKS
jgi:hypothetical protein